MEGAQIVTNSPSVGGAAESLPNTSQSRTPSNAQDVKQSTSISKELQELLDNPNKLRQGDCYVGQVLLDLPEEDSKLLNAALNDKRIRHMDLQRLLSNTGYKMSESTMRRHRSGSCRCPK